MEEHKKIIPEVDQFQSSKREKRTEKSVAWSPPPPPKKPLHLIPVISRPPNSDF